MIVFVCENQRALYHPEAASSVIFVGVPSPQLPPCPDISAPFQDDCKSDSPSHHTIRTNPNLKVFTFLVLGIICPRKNQTWAVDVFQQFVNNHEHHLHASNTSLRLLIVGARYTRAYEVEYLQKLNEAVEDFRCRRDASCIPGGGGHSIEVHDVTDHVDQFYNVTDVLLVTSLNEVTPMVIPEALAWGIPVIATNIAGIPEMFQDGIEGFLVSPDDNQRAIECMYKLVHDKELNVSMGEAAKQRFEKAFSLESMVQL